MKFRESRLFSLSSALWLIIVSLSVAAGYYAYLWSRYEGYSRLDSAATHQLDLYAAHISMALARHQHLPDLLELEDAVLDTLRNSESLDQRDLLNRRLAQVNVKAGSQSLFILDNSGVVVAASDWYLPHSPIGKRFTSSRIFTAAMDLGDAGTFFGNPVGRVPEYYFSRRIRSEGATLGVAVAKVSLEPLVYTWIEGGVRSNSEKFIVLDEANQIILSSVRDWMLRPFLIVAENQELPAASAPSSMSAPILTVFSEERLPHGANRVSFRDDVNPTKLQTAVIHGQTMSQPRWHLMILSNNSEVSTAAWNAAFGGSSLTFASCVLIMYWLRRRREIRIRLAARDMLQRAHDELEVRVQERTRELAQTNADLKQEVLERERTQEALSKTLDELVQAGKMALLGQMATGITHEINQPLTALRALSHNTHLLIERGRHTEAQHNLQLITDITDRIARIAAELRTFGRKGPAQREPVDVSKAVESSLLLLESKTATAGIDIRNDVHDGLKVWADHVRLEQVLVNLIGNAIDALVDWSGERVLSIATRVEGPCAMITVIDSGPGMLDEVIDQIFEPFFTTKPAGNGLGLGLAISASIISSFEGTLRAIKVSAGAHFEIELQLVMYEPHV